jgi:integrase
LVEPYQNHLITGAGLQPSTCAKWTSFVRLFLKAQFKPNMVEREVRHLTPEALLDYVLQQGQHYQPGQLQSLASALRSFCRFLCASGRQAPDLSPALPPISGHHRQDLPTCLSRRPLQQLLEEFGLCLARLGWRAGEVAALSLEDVDWRNGWLRWAAPKGRRERPLPLPAEVGRALASYLRSAPPRGTGRRLFRTLRHERPLRASWLSERVGAAMARGGLGRAGKRAQLLRRTFATHLVQAGASLKAVADLLGHASLSPTQIYAKVNLPMLRAVAPPWPGEVGRGRHGLSKRRQPSIWRAVAPWVLPSSPRELGWAIWLSPRANTSIVER